MTTLIEIINTSVFLCHSPYLRSSSSWLSSSTLSLSAASTKARNWSILASIFKRMAQVINNCVRDLECEGRLLLKNVNWPAPDHPWAGQFLAPSLPHGSRPWQLQLSPCPSQPLAAQYAAASPLAPPAALWCLKSFGCSVMMSLLTKEIQKTRGARMMSDHGIEKNRTNQLSNSVGTRSLEVLRGLCGWAWHWLRMLRSSWYWWKRHWGCASAPTVWPPLSGLLFLLWLVWWRGTQCVWLCVLVQISHIWAGTENIWGNIMEFMVYIVVDKIRTRICLLIYVLYYLLTLQASKNPFAFVPCACDCSIIFSKGLIQFHSTPLAFGKICFPEETYHSCLCTTNLRGKHWWLANI